MAHSSEGNLARCSPRTAGRVRLMVGPPARWNHYGVYPDPGCYEERYRLTRGTWLAAAGSLVAVTAAVAPGIPVIDTSTGPVPSVEGPAPS